MITNKWLIGVGILAAVLSGTIGEYRLAAQGDTGKLKFELYQDAAKEYRWRLKASNDSVLATGGQGYKSKADCEKGVERLRSEASKDKYTFEVYEDKAKDFRWRLKATNGQVVASSGAGYKAKADCEKAIDTIKKGAAKAEIAEKK